jgi:putative membrane protein
LLIAWGDVVLKVVASLILLAVGVIYLRGRARLRRDGPEPPAWRTALYVLGLAALGATLTVLDEAADERFSMHMVQHLSLVMVAVPLLMLGNPLAPMLWGLPPRARRAVAATLVPGARGRRALAALTSLPVAGVVYTATMWLWHVPALYDVAVEHELLHALEHLTFIGTALLFWWPVLEPAPRVRPRAHPGLVILYLVLSTAQNTALGIALTLPERSFYPHYAAHAAALGISAVDDQAFGGGLMWSMGHMYLLPILLIAWRIARDGEREAAADLPA